jgi:hypothetical protein
MVENSKSANYCKIRNLFIANANIKIYAIKNSLFKGIFRV